MIISLGRESRKEWCHLLYFFSHYGNILGKCWANFDWSFYSFLLFRSHEMVTFGPTPYSLALPPWTTGMLDRNAAWQQLKQSFPTTKRHTHKLGNYWPLWDDNSKKGQIIILKLKKCTFFGKETKNEHDQKARSTARQQLKERFATTKRHTQTN